MAVYVPSTAGEMLQNRTVQRLKGGNPTAGLPIGWPVTCPRELSVTFKPQCKDNRMAKYSKQNIYIFIKHIYYYH